MLFIMLVALCFVSAIFNEIWTRRHFKTDWYLGIDGNYATYNLKTKFFDIEIATYSRNNF